MSKKTALVVPTIRENCIIDFLKSWENEPFDEIIVIEDNPKKTFNLGIKHHYSWKEINEDLGDNAHIISRRDSAIRSYGFLVAHHLADYVFTLDDDCYRIPEENYIESHLNNLNNTKKWTELIPGLRTRGIPYHNLGKLDVMINIGLWTNVPDFDAIGQLSNPIDNFMPNITNRVLSKNQYVPHTGMNFCFRKEVAVLTYFPLMGEGYPYRRFDDIWFGIICKKICDYLNYNITCGHPFVKHMKASDPFVNLIKEAPGIQTNETFWETIDNIKLTAITPKGCMEEVGNSLCGNTDPYLRTLGQAITIWTCYF